MNVPTETTQNISKILGPLLLVRGVSILIAPAHFRSLIQRLETEVSSISFSMVPVFLFATFLSFALFFRDLESVAGILIFTIGVVGTVKTSVVMLVPRMLARKVRALKRIPFVEIIAATCLLAGAYFAWVGYF